MPGSIIRQHHDKQNNVNLNLKLTINEIKIFGMLFDNDKTLMEIIQNANHNYGTISEEKEEMIKSYLSLIHKFREAYHTLEYDNS